MREKHFDKVKSPVHCRLFELYNVWIRITNSVIDVMLKCHYGPWRISWEIMSCKHGLNVLGSLAIILGFPP